MYQCVECGRKFEEPTGYREAQGEHHGQPVYEELEGCPRCGGEFQEVEDYGRAIELMIQIKDNYDLSYEQRWAVNTACNVMEGEI